MKRNSILICILFAITANSFIAAKAQVNTTDSLALVDLYNSTNGSNWYNHTNWLTTKPVSTWYGVTVKANSVTTLLLYTNNLHGTIPSSIGNLVKLTVLNFNNDHLNGVIPVEIGNLVTLTDLSLGNNLLSGTIPSSVGNLVKLTQLGLTGNQLSGAIPAEIGNLLKLTQLYLDHNQLNGAIPSSIGNLVKLEYLELFNNQLSGTIPSSIGNLAKLIVLILEYNQLSGSIPSELSNLVKLKTLSLASNQLSDTIPSSIGNLVKLSSLYLDHNQLSGAIPSSFQKFKTFFYIDLSYNLLNQIGEPSDISTNYNYISGYINNNRFTFDGLQVIAKHYSNVTYTPQDTILPIHRDGNTLSVSAGGVLSKNTYRWFKAGDTSKTVIKKDSTFSPAQSGMYYAQVTNSVATKLKLYTDTISYTMPVAQTQNTIANVAAVKAFNSQFSIYPNPAKDVIHIQVNGNAIVTLTNSAGKILLAKTINNSDAINVSSFANGTYYLQNKTTGETQKVVVVH